MTGKLHAARLLRDLDTAISLGCPLPEALEQWSSAAPPAWRPCLVEAAHSIQRGSSLSQALSQASALPQELRHALMMVPEPGVLARLAELLEAGAWRERQVRLVVAYPLLLLAAAFALVWLIYGLVGTALAGLISDMAQLQPMPTRWALAASQMVSNPFFVSAEVFFLGGFYALTAGLGPLARIRPHLPVLGSWVQRSESVLWLEWFDFYLSAGVNIPEAMRKAGAGCFDQEFLRQLERAARRAEHGDSMGAATEDLLPELGRWMVQQGEAAEFPPGLLSGVANALRREQDLLAESGLLFLEVAGVGSMFFILPPVILGYLLPIVNMLANL